MTQDKTCYYAIRVDKAGEKRVRFGASRRKDAQIETCLATWSKIAVLLAKNGCRLVEIGPNGRTRKG